MNFTGVNKIIFEYCHHPRPYHLEYESKNDIKNIMDGEYQVRDLGYSTHVMILSNDLFTVEYINSSDNRFIHLVRRKYGRVIDLFDRENKRRSLLNLKPNDYLFGSESSSNEGYYGY